MKKDYNPVVAASRKLAEQCARVYDAHRRAVVADLKRKTKGKDGWTPWQVTLWLVREAKDQSVCIDPFDAHSIEMGIRAQVALELLSEEP